MGCIQMCSRCAREGFRIFDVILMCWLRHLFLVISASSLLHPQIETEPKPSGRKISTRGSVGTVDGCRTAGGHSSDGLRRRPCRQRSRKQSHLIEAARLAAPIKCDEGPFSGGDERPFSGRVWGGFAPPAKFHVVLGAAPPSQNRIFF